MQKIFYNAKFKTFEGDGISQALLSNDESVVLCGNEKEILEMKNDETEVFDLNENLCLPCFFDFDAHIFEMIESRLKNANLEQNIENTDEIDENFEKFENFEVYKNQFLEIQDEFIGRGICTVCEYNLSAKEFTFWKKMAEQKQLKIDVIGFVDIVSSKMVMDNNCVSYRKCKNHFRLGGYSITVDGSLFEGKAWLKKKYKYTKSYFGNSKITAEHLELLIKNAIDEKKQIVANCSGEKATDLFLNCFENAVKEKKDLDTFRPIIKNCCFVTKKQFCIAKKLGISMCFDVSKIDKKLLRSFVGYFRSKLFLPYASAIKYDIKTVFCSKEKGEQSFVFVLKNIFNKKLKKHFGSFENLLKKMYADFSFLCFEDQKKGSLENGKENSFVVFDAKNETLSMQDEFVINKVFVNSELEFEK